MLRRLLPILLSLLVAAPPLPVSAGTVGSTVGLRTGTLPTGYDTVSSATTTSGTLEDVSGLSTTVTLTTSAKIRADLSGVLEAAVAGTAVAGVAISVNAVDSQENQVSLAALATPQAFSVVYESGTLSAGTYTIKGRFRRVSGTATVQLDTAQLHASGLQGAYGVGVFGSTGSTDNRLLRSDGTAGTNLQASGVSLDDSANLSGIGDVSLTGTVDGVDVSSLGAYTSGTEVRTVTAANTFGTVRLGTSASNLVQLDGSARLPAVPGALLTGLTHSQIGAADSWDVRWTSASGSPATSGNYTGSPTASIIGAGAFDGSAATFNGVSAWKFTPTSASARQGLQLDLSQTMNTSFELRVRFYGPAAPFMVGFGLANAVDCQLLFSPGTTALNHTTSTAVGSTPDITNQWVTLTVRALTAPATGTVSGEGAYLFQAWLGEHPTGNVQGVSCTNSVSVDNALRIERNSGTSVTPFYIAEIGWRSGLNERLPSQTFAGKGLDQ